MKFGRHTAFVQEEFADSAVRYLTENLTPEWKRAYIDYRACKKAIKVIAVRLGTDQPKFTEDLAGTDGKDSSDADDDDDDYGPSAPPKKASASVKDGGRGTGSKVTSPKTPDPTKSSRLAPGTPGTAKARNVSGSGSYGATETSPRPIGSGKLPPLPPLDLGESSLPEETTLSRIRPVRMETSSSIKPGVPSVVIMPEGRAPETVSSPENGQAGQSTSDEGQLSDSARHLTSPKILKDKAGSVMSRSPRFAPRSSRTLPSPNVAAAAASPQVGRRSLRSMTLPSPGQNMRVARSFDELYDMLEADEKAFFDLLEHEFDKVETFYHNREQDAIRRAHDLRDQLRELAEHRRIFHELYPNGMPEWEAKVGKYITVPNVANVAKSTGLAAFTQTVRQRLNAVTDRQAEPETEENGVAGAESSVSEEHRRKSLREAMANDAEHQHYNPERYQKYKRDLRNASMEFYRQLELIKNYRIMNITGFRKALKKFEKTTKIYCMEMYTDEKIARGTFAKGSTIDKMIKETEELFTTHFEHGNQKKARDRLRRQTREKTHYYSVFRTGLWLGLGFPAAVFALVEACHEHTRQVVPGWNGLLQIYGGFYLTIIFALLFQLNLEAFVRSRINYEFVMELSKPHLDYRSFAEIPSFLFMTLSYCFFFSFYRVATDNVDPTTWPLAWLVFAICFFLNPLDYFRRSSRYWFLRVLFRVITPGYSRVEFIAFFVADELNSLTYTVQNFYFIGCTYSHDWPRDRDIYSVCPSGQSWPYALLLCVPAIIRLIQCIKRYRDSGLYIHLVNAGKYLSSILQFCLFVHWRAHGRHLHDASFIVWVIFAIVSSVYTSSWDLVVDWSLFRPDSGLLRQDRGYSHPYIYYFGMVTNVLIRFVWVWYIPNPRVHTNSRSFYFALAEMLRRWQWNFFRVETEHLGNADAYRVTREIPLPYRRVEHDSDEEDAKPSLKRTNTKLSVRLDKIKRGLTGEGSGRGPNELNVGGRGHAQQREYEARRPGDDLDSRRPEGEV